MADFCECGCGEPLGLDGRGRSRRFVLGHHRRRIAWVHIPLFDKDDEVVAYAKLDAADVRLVGTRSWYRTVQGYAAQNMKDGRILLHRLVLELRSGDSRQADHINRDRLDNRRANLRILGPSGNQQNTDARPGASSRFRGVGWHGQLGKWRAYGRKDGKLTGLGVFEDEVEAARAAEAWRSANLPLAQPDPELAAALERDVVVDFARAALSDEADG